MLVISDTSCINYLVLIGSDWILEPVFGRVFLPSAVVRELTAERAPTKTRSWALAPPAWITEQEVESPGVVLHHRLGPGERDALHFAYQQLDGFLLIDDLLGRREALRLGLRFTGTLGILRRAHLAKLIDLREAIDALRQTSFKIDPKLLDDLIESAKRP